jgi:glucosamine-6-phosphate deaminase
MPRSQLRFGAAEHGVPVAIFPDPTALGQALAREILEEAESARTEGRTYLLGCPAGRSLRSTYSALAALAAAQEANLSRLVIAMMDEYLVATPKGPRLCPADAHYSCRGYGRREILDRINDGLSDGHVAFNPAGTTLAARTRVIRLSPATRHDNLESFPGFASLDEVPKLGVGVGLGTIVDQSRRVTLVMTGTNKRAAVSRLRHCSDFTSDWPVSFIYRCRNPRILVDRFASPVA